MGPWQGRQPFPRNLAPKEREPRLAGSNLLPKAAGMWSATPASSGLHAGRSTVPLSLCLRAEQKSHRLPGESSLDKVGPWSSRGGLLIKAGISLTSLRKLLVSFKGCGFGSEGFFGSRSGMIRAARGWDWVHEESARSRKRGLGF